MFFYIRCICQYKEKRTCKAVKTHNLVVKYLSTLTSPRSSTHVLDGFQVELYQNQQHRYVLASMNCLALFTSKTSLNPFWREHILYLLYGCHGKLPRPALRTQACISQPPRVRAADHSDLSPFPRVALKPISKARVSPHWVNLGQCGITMLVL